jgi:hypothetical protein
VSVVGSRIISFMELEPRTRVGRALLRLGVSVPLLGMIAVLIAIGWTLGPWLPVGVVAGTVLILGGAWLWSRAGRELLKTDPAAGQRILDAQQARVGHALARIVALWLFASLLFVILILAIRL